MRHLIRWRLGAAVAVALVAVVVRTGIGQTINESCPYLQTNAVGFPLNPPYSQYATDTSQTTIVAGQFFDLLAPCCGTITTVDNGAGGTTTTASLSGSPIYNPAEETSFCQPPTFNLGNGPPNDPFGLSTVINPFFGNTCPGNVDFNLTREVNGAVKNCIPPSAVLPDRGGGSNFLAATGANAG